MIAESRELAEHTDAYDKCMQLLQSYIRREFDSTTLKNDTLLELAKQRLMLVARDWSNKNNKNMSDKECENIAYDAIDVYKYNQENKPTNDMRGKHRFGMF